MNKELMRQFFKPDWRKLTVLAIFFLIVYAGHIQSWVFSGKDLGLPKPRFYDILESVPFWEIWMYLLVPIFILTGGAFNSVPLWVIWIIYLIYFYALSCLIIFILDKSRK